MEPMQVSEGTTISEGELKQLGISWGSGKIYKTNSYTKQVNTWYLKSPTALFFFST